MQFIDLLNLIWDTRHTGGLSMIIVYLVPATAVLALVGELVERRYLRKLEQRAANGEWEIIQAARDARNEHDREVKAWEDAARRRGGL